MQTISNFFAAVAALFTFRSKKLEVDNSPAMQANATARADSTTADRASGEVSQALKTGDLEQLRKDAAE